MLGLKQSPNPRTINSYQFRPWRVHLPWLIQHAPIYRINLQPERNMLRYRRLSEHPAEDCRQDSSDNDRKAAAVPEMREAWVERMKDAVIGAYIELSQPRITADMLFSRETLWRQKRGRYYPDLQKRFNPGRKGEPGNHSYHICSSHSTAEQASALCILDILFFFLYFP